jgi:serine/threonine protein phosphatase PrpC
MTSPISGSLVQAIHPQAGVVLAPLRTPSLSPTPNDPEFGKLWRNTLKATIEHWVRQQVLPHQDHEITLYQNRRDPSIVGFCYIAKHLLRSIALNLYLPRSPAKEPRSLQFPELTGQGYINWFQAALQATHERTDLDSSLRASIEVLLKELELWKPPLQNVISKWSALETVNAAIPFHVPAFAEAVSALDQALQELLPLWTSKGPSEPHKKWYEFRLPFYSGELCQQFPNILNSYHNLCIFCIEPLLVLQGALSNLVELEILLDRLELPQPTPLTVTCQEAAAQGKRRSMEDAHVVLNTDRVCIAGVFDGYSGDAVAQMAKRYFENSFLELLNQYNGCISQAFNQAIQEIHAFAPHALTGSTVVVCAIDKQRGLVYTLTLGDSEARLYSPDQGEIPLSCVRDWGDAKEGLRAIRYHDLNPVQKASPQTFSLSSWMGSQRWLSKPRFPTPTGTSGTNISRSLGGRCVPGLPEHPSIIQKIKMTAYGLQTGATLIIACDGFWDFVSSEEVEQFLKQQPHQDTARALVELALSKKSSDNITVLVLKMG